MNHPRTLILSIAGTAAGFALVLGAVIFDAAAGQPAATSTLASANSSNLDVTFLTTDADAKPPCDLTQSYARAAYQAQ